MNEEVRHEYNVLINLLTMAIAILFATCVSLTADVVNLKGMLDETETTFSEQLELRDEEIRYLNNVIEETNKKLDNIIMMSYDYNYVVRVVANECQNQPFEGKMAVAQTILERSLEWGMTPEQVVKQKGQYTVPMREENVSPEVWEACKLVLIA